MPATPEYLSLIWRDPRPILSLPDKESLQQHVIERIQDRKHFDIRLSDANGDSMIITWAYHLALQRFCQQHNLDISRTYLRNFHSSQSDTEHAIGIFHLLSIVENLSIGMSTDEMSFLGMHLTKVSTALGMRVLEEDLKRPPLPLAMKATALEKFNQEEVLSMRNHIRASCKERKIVTIAQGGSIPTKRLDDTQIIEVAQLVKEVDPTSFVVLVSDQAYRYFDVNTISKLSSYFDMTFADKNSNRTMGALAASDVTISTDSFYSWLAAGSRALMPDRAGFLHENDLHVLHTIGDPKRWAVPGASIVFHPDLVDLAASTAIGGFIKSADYRQLSGSEGIRKADLDLFKAHIADALSESRLFHQR